MKAATACGSCGTELRDNAKFCDACGTPLTSAAGTAEYKQVTVLFADVVHSMDIAAAVGAERLRELMAELFDRSAAVVQRFGGTVDKFTGDGIMAVFGAPVALEDHAVRACLAARGVQEEAKPLAVDAHTRDGVDLRLRVGLNSGEVIAGDIGSRPLSYTAIGEQVGMAQRMESVAPPGGVMLSESTARLVEHCVLLGELEMVRIKGAESPVMARRLVTTASSGRRPARQLSTLVGRDWEISTVAGILDQAIGGRGRVVGLVGPPGIGKSRMVGETVSIAAERGAEVFTTYCESHTSEIPFHVAARLLRDVFAISGLEDDAARTTLRARMADADPEDLVLLDDLLGIGAPGVPLPAMDPAARRRRLAALLNAAAVARTTPAVFVIEDAHWIDEISQAMIGEFAVVVPQTHLLVLITYRPEYDGMLDRLPSAHRIALAPLDDSDCTALATELLGTDPSVATLVGQIAERAAGNPFFTEEIVRDLAERGIVHGEPGAYVCREGTVDVRVPASLQATIAARIDRLGPTAKCTLNAAAVIGLRFELGSACRTGGAHRFGRTDRSRTRRPGDVHAPRRRVRLPASADPRGGVRVAAEIGSCPTCIDAWPTRSKNAIRGRLTQMPRSLPSISKRREISARHSTGTCARARGCNFATSRPLTEVGSGHVRSPTGSPPAIRTGPPCGSLPEP